MPSPAALGPEVPFYAQPLSCNSRRSSVLGLRGMVASSQPLASEAGMRMLQKGGNAADAAVAMAAAANVTEPCSTGIGGDAFALFWDAGRKEMKCVMGNGRSPEGLTLEAVRQRGFRTGPGRELPAFHALAITVPGAAAAWEDVVKLHGKLSLSEVLQPAIELAEEGFPVSSITAHHWCAGVPQLQQAGGPGVSAFLNAQGRGPAPGEVMRNPDLAATFRTLAQHGAAKGFYSGRVGEAIAAAVAERDGVLTAADLAAHHSATPEPISTTYRGHTVWETPPPTQGIGALMALNIMEGLHDDTRQHWGSGTALHHQIEAMRLAFADILQYNADPDVVPVPVAELLDKGYAAQRMRSITADKASREVRPGNPSATLAEPGPPGMRNGGDTVYFCTVDRWGNGCSFINSNYMGFGTGIVPDGCGFTLQNRGANFILDPAHPNCLASNKRPYHTIIPAAATTPEGDLYAVFGVMGAFMQPQGHMQVLSNMLDYGMEPQAALDAPRFCLYGVDSTLGPDSVSTSQVELEEGFSDAAIAELKARGHRVAAHISGHDRAVFGRGQIIKRDPHTGVLCAGSDPRADGLAIGW